jgi:zinc protease
MLTRETVAIDGEFLSRLSEDWFDLLELALFSPRFDEAEFNQCVEQSIDELQESTDSDEGLGALAFHRALMTPDKRAIPMKGTPESLKRITLEDIRYCHTQLTQRGRLLIGACGDINDYVQSRLERLEETFPESQPASISTSSASTVSDFDLWLVHKPNRTQFQMFLGSLAPAVHSTNYVGLTIGMSAFGGMFTSRLSQEIREKRGWSYAAWASYVARADIGWWTARTFPSNEHAFQTLVTMSDMLDALQAKGLTQDEYEYAVDTLVAGFAFRLQTDKQHLEDAINLRLLNQPSETTENWPETVKNTSLGSVNKALTSFEWPRAVCVMVGNADIIEKSTRDWSRKPQVRRISPEDILFDRWL